MTGTVFDIKEMAVHDGPGLRTTVFLKGCPLRCKWCHNPDGLLPTPQLSYRRARCRSCGLCLKPCAHEMCRPYGKCILTCPENCLTVVGREVTAAVLAEELLPSARVLGEVFGGFTFSGGEPLYQSSFLLEVAALLRPYSLAIETSGYASTEIFRRVLTVMDYVILDIKLAAPIQHRTYTGADNAPILDNYRTLRLSGKPYLIRTPLIPGITDTEENLTAIRTLIGDSPWQTIPYNPFAGAKYTDLGMTYEFADIKKGDK